MFATIVEGLLLMSRNKFAWIVEDLLLLMSRNLLDAVC